MSCLGWAFRPGRLESTAAINQFGCSLGTKQSFLSLLMGLNCPKSPLTDPAARQVAGPFGRKPPSRRFNEAKTFPRLHRTRGAHEDLMNTHTTRPQKERRLALSTLLRTRILHYATYPFPYRAVCSVTGYGLTAITRRRGRPQGKVSSAMIVWSSNRKQESKIPNAPSNLLFFIPPI